MNHYAVPVVTGSPFWPLLVAAMGVIAIVVLLVLLRRYPAEQEGPTSAEWKALDDGETRVLAMLRQVGGPIGLSELSEAVSMSPDDVTNLLDELEGRKLIKWQFDSERKAYFVHAR
jgi:DNA-binding MarR family transcriptional regulator